MNTCFRCAGILLAVAAGLLCEMESGTGAAEARESKRFETEIAAFERADAASPPKAGGIVFVGSSSIRMWKTLTNDFADLPVIQRGFGGSHIADCIFYAERVVLRYRPKLVVLYAGDNDLASGKTPEQVLEDFKRFGQLLHQAQPELTVKFISIKPSPARAALLEKMRAANALVAAYCQGDKRFEYIDVAGPMLQADGTPRPELFVDDRLHLNAAGYELWARIVRPHLR